MIEPEQALERARAAAVSIRSQEYQEPESLSATTRPPDISAKLIEWALIEPDLSKVRSTRRAGAPISALKRLLLRLLYQYNVQVIAQQTRFNVHVIRYIRDLEARVARLEQTLDEQPPDSR